LNHHETVRAAFPGLSAGAYLNTGTYGIMPEPALTTFIDLIADYERYGLFSTSGLHQKMARTREDVAALLGTTASQIAFTGNATDGTNLVLAGLDWKAGDEVITTDEEHEAIVHPLLYLQCTKGIVVRRVRVSADPAVMQRRCEEVASNRTRLLAFSHVTCESGTRLPAAAMCAWAARHEVLSLVDGAQSLGVIPTDADQIGCDFYTGNGHKWLCGPKGTGIFYASPAQLEALAPAHVGAGTLEVADVEACEAIPWSTGRRFEFGTRATALYAGLGESLAWLVGLGWDAITTYTARLSGDLKRRIQARPYLRLLTPEAFSQSAGLTTFVMEGWQAGELSGELMRREKIRVRVIPHYNALRISTTYFNNEEDLDLLMATLDAIAA
jgi:selenocysteine lyase/cysteine desulfurase